MPIVGADSNAACTVRALAGRRFQRNASGKALAPFARAPLGEGIPSKLEDMGRGEVKKAFKWEFLNRLDGIILFSSLTDEDQDH
ncbi:MAG: hypothetical protein ACLQU1_29320 [Bryobacteraceae bacterium]